MLLIALALLGAQQSALSAAEKAAGKEPQTPAGAQVRALVENCDAHKFETVIEVVGPDGGLKHSRVKLCGTEGQSDADWITTLKDAVAKTKLNLQMPAPVREQIVSAINAEIARVEGKPGPASAPLPPPRTASKPSAFADYAALPPIPDKPPPAVHVLPGASAALPLLPRPAMSFACFTPGDAGDAPCTDFNRDTLLTVRADEDLPPGTSLRFVRSGEAKADVQLTQLKRGKEVRLPLPADVCSHAGGGRLDIKIMRSVPQSGAEAQEVGDDGPYNLRC